MISSSIQMVQRKLGINILLAVIIGITVLLGIVCVSTYDKLTEKTAPYNDIMKMHGGIYYFSYGDFEKFLEQSEVLPDKICGVKESLVGIDNWTFHLLAYDDIQEKYKIPLSEGVWYTETEKSEYVNVVVTPNKFFKLGDIVHPADYMPDADEDLYLKICGVTTDSFSYFVMHRHPEQGIQELYDNFYVDSPEQFSLMFLSVDDIEPYDGFLYSTFLLLGFEEKDNEEYVYRHSFTFTKQMDMGELREKTDRVIKQKTDKVFPVFIVVLVMTLICTISIVAIETIFDLRVYATYFICGMSWRIVIGMNAIRSTVVYIFGLGFMYVFSRISSKLLVEQGLIIAFGNKQALVIVGLFVVFVLSFCISPAVIVRRRKPVEVIRSTTE